MWVWVLLQAWVRMWILGEGVGVDVKVCMKVDGNVSVSASPACCLHLRQFGNSSLLASSLLAVTDEGAAFLADAFSRNQELQFLSLTENLLTDAGASTLAAVLARKQLSVHVDCDRNSGITAAGHAALAAAMLAEPAAAVHIGRTQDEL